MSDIDAVTCSWIRNRSDELAAQSGCWIDESAGAWAIWWIERYCVLYEGEWAGAPLLLNGCHICGSADYPVFEEWDNGGREASLDRAEKFRQCLAAGHRVHWQYEVTMRMFGWMRKSDRWKRPIRRFRQAAIYVPKKNCKSPTLAAWGLYLLAGDGESGQKVFFGAKDGAQAREISGKHAIEMVKMSPELSDECTINLSLMQVTHEASRSFLKPMSSSNARTQKSKEGINGSVLIDETHVVDRDFIRRIKRAGISRSEPVHAEFSTAGNDPDCYGKERFDYAERVARGDEEDSQLLVAIYAAPAELTDEDLDADPIKYGKMANPAWGHTVGDEEYMADYSSSKRSPRELLDFKMYRLNIWQNSANPWIKPEWWERCRQDYTYEDMHGRHCWAALDLSTVRDFTSLCLAFPEPGEEGTRFLWWFWLPEDTKQEYAQHIDIDRWLRNPRCRLSLTSGARIDYDEIRETFRALTEQYQIRQMAYDDWNAEKVTQEIEVKTGVERIEFGQGMKTMNEPTKFLESLIIDGKAYHNGDPIMAWMMGNATIKSDANGNYKPLKPEQGSVRKIDGVITMVMANGISIHQEEPMLLVI